MIINEDHPLNEQLSFTGQFCKQSTEQRKAKGSPHTLHKRRSLEDGSEPMDYQQTEVEQQKETVAAMLDMDARDIEDLGELLQVLNGSQRIKRPVQADSPAEGAKKARTESIVVRLHSVGCRTALSLGARKKEVGPYCSKKGNQPKSRYCLNKDRGPQAQQGHLGVHHLPDIFMSDDSE